MSYFIAFLTALLITAAVTPLVRGLALKYKIIDEPGRAERKIHNKPTPLLGGLAIFIGVVTTLIIYCYASDYLALGNLEPKYIVGVVLGMGVLLVGGILDDVYNLKPWQQIIWPLLATAVIIGAGIGITEITNPFGGVIHLDQWEHVLFWANGVAYKITMPADVITFGWMLLMMYTTKFLDGLDGLTAGITGIGAFMIFALAMFTQYYQPDTAMLAIIVAGVMGGFLIWNFNPAKIFLGEAGSTICGFLLGVLAIISGSKIATALLVMAIPVLDLIWVIIRRIFLEKRSPFKGDKKHFHFRMLEIGFTQRQAVIFLYILAFVFGTATLVLQSRYKLLTLGILAVVMLAMGLILVNKFRKV